MTHGQFPKREDFRDIRYVGILLDPKHRNADVVRELKKCGTIGCRDVATESFLKKNGIPTYLSRCATLTFPRYTGPRSGIVCVDVDDKMAARVKEKFGKCGGDISRTSHSIAYDKTGGNTLEVSRAQYSQAYDLLMIYRQATLVVTPRIHAALPCIAFG